MNRRGCYLSAADRLGGRQQTESQNGMRLLEMTLTADTQCSDSWKGDLVCHRVRMPDRGWDYVRELGCRQIAGNSRVMCGMCLGGWAGRELELSVLKVGAQELLLGGFWCEGLWD